ncbi:MAG: hypothetical protein AB7T32_12715 [Dehalococcoidia bacterium]
MQLRRLDPLANAGPFQKLQKNPVKSWSLTEAQFERVRSERPELFVQDFDNGVIGVPYRDYLMIHYSYPDFENFRARFPEMLNQVTAASNNAEAPRGAVLFFRDRPNVGMSETVFWSVMLAKGPEWVEMNHVALPEQEAPGDTIGDGFTVREATNADLALIGAVDESVGLPPLTEAGLNTLARDSRTGRIVLDSSGAPAAFFNLRGEPGGWGILETPVIRPELRAQLAGPILRWAIAWLRTNNARRIRQLVMLDDAVMIGALRDAGFTPGETGLIFSRSVDAVAENAELESRKFHSSHIVFGNWR